MHINFHPHFQILIKSEDKGVFLQYFPLFTQKTPLKLQFRSFYGVGIVELSILLSFVSHLFLLKAYEQLLDQRFLDHEKPEASEASRPQWPHPRFA